jgi:hypothetical protein
MITEPTGAGHTSTTAITGRGQRGRFVRSGVVIMTSVRIYCNAADAMT